MLRVINFFLFVLLFLITACEGPFFSVQKDPDTIAPLLSISNPADQAVVSDTVTIAVYAYDNDEIDTVELYLNDEIIFLENKDNFSEEDWKNLYKLSEETFVEESDSLKEGAAGAGLTDND